jgi:hypothetical protein
MGNAASSSTDTKMGPYHDTLPTGVTLSQVISTRSIEPFYGLLEQLADKKVTTYIQEIFEKNLHEAQISTSIHGNIIALPPPQDRDLFSLDELALYCTWISACEIAIDGTPLITSPAAHHSRGHKSTGDGSMSSRGMTNGDTSVTTLPMTAMGIQATLVVAKPVFWELLTVFQQRYPKWTGKDLFLHYYTPLQKSLSEEERGHSWKKRPEPGSYEEFERTVYKLHAELFEVSTIRCHKEEKLERTINGSSVIAERRTLWRYTLKRKVHYQYTVCISALDLRPNMQTILSWLTTAPAIDNDLSGPLTTD